MIASLVVTLDCAVAGFSGVVNQIAQMPGVQLCEGESFSHRIPILIDSSDPDSLEETTRRLQSIRWVSRLWMLFCSF
jgi:hypothetical protein